VGREFCLSVRSTSISERVLIAPWCFDHGPKKLKTLSRSEGGEYQKWIRERVKEFGPSLIFDEMNLAEEDHSDRLEDTGIPWVYMDIPEHVRRRFGLSVTPIS